MTEDYQNDNLPIDYQFLVFIKISRTKDATTLKGLNFVGIKFRGFRENRRKICNYCYLTPLVIDSW